MKITTKGQVTIPLHFRKKYGLNPNTSVIFAEKDGHLAILPQKQSPAGACRAWIDAVAGTASTPLSTDEILKITRGD